jgi:hypothetical protein
MTRRRNGYSDFAIPMKSLTDALTKVAKANPRFTHEELVEHGVKNILRGARLFEQYEDEFLGYIVTNALNKADRDRSVNEGVNPVTGTRIPEPTSKPQPKPLPPEQVVAERAKAETQAMARLLELAPIMFMKLPTPFGKPLGELTGKEGRKLAGWMGAIFKGVPDNKRLCDVKGEAQLREIWAKRK